MEHEIAGRIEKFKVALTEKGARAALVTTDENVFYFSGFTGDSSELLVTMNGSFLFTDFRYIEQAEKETHGCEIIETRFTERPEKIDEVLKNTETNILGIEKQTITLDYFDRMNEKVSVGTYRDISPDIERLRAIKSPFELAHIQKAADISDRVFTDLIKKIKPGVCEIDIEAELTYLFGKAGCKISFPPIIASGENSSLPHAPVTNRALKNGDFLTIDFGGKLGKYCTDCTRTMGIGALAKEQEKVYDIVKFAQATAFAAIRPGISCGELDAVARKLIEEAGYGENFGHGLGHGVGLDVHEFPRIGGGDPTVLEPGMVITIEPGIYLKNQFGVRIEDMCYVTEKGGVSFNQLDRALTII